MAATKYLTVIALILLLASTGNVQAQAFANESANTCKGYAHHPTNPAAKTSVASLQEDNYDIYYLKFDLHLTHLSAAITGSVTTKARVIAPVMAAYVFELDDSLTVDSVTINAAKLPFATEGQIRTVALPYPLTENTYFTAQVFYHGTPRDAEKINDPGLHNGGDSITFSIVEPFFAHMWCPCKQSLNDKIDSVDMWLTIPAEDKAGSNGVLQATTSVDPTHIRYEWKTRYPIDYYLISVAVSPYDEYSYTMHFDGSMDTMPIINYISKKSPKSIAELKPWLDSTELLVNYYSSLFGRYPFWKEKYGHCYTPAYVNMEHQTMTSTKFSSLTVIAHELAHQWFGDYVTCGTWKDIWLNEGFAAYAQYLCYNHFDGYAAGYNYLKKIQDDATNEDWGSVYVPDTTYWPRIFNTRLTYNKSASVIHMLRYEVNDDEQFFAMLRAYLQQYKWHTATTDNFKSIAEEYASKPLDTFFQQWIYKEGFPFIDASWNQVNDALFLRINQTSSAPWSQFVFSMPLEIKCHSAQGDTTLTVHINEPSQSFNFLCGKSIDYIDIDPNRWMLYRKAKEPAKDTTLNLLPVNATIYPNPSANTIYVAYKNINNGILSLFDITGRKAMAYTMPWNAGIATIDVSTLAKGIYVYRITDNGILKTEGKFRKD